MGYNGFIHTESSCPIPAIPHPAHSHGWCCDRHGRHAWSHCKSLLPASLHNHSWCGQCRLHRHADFGWGWRSAALTERRTGPSGHCAICALQRLQNGQFSSLSNLTCWLPVFSWTVLLYCSWTYNLFIHHPPHPPLLFKSANRRLLLALPVLQMGIMDLSRSRYFR